MNNPAHEETQNNINYENQMYRECLDDAIDEYAHDGARDIAIIANDYGVKAEEIIAGAKELQLEEQS